MPEESGAGGPVAPADVLVVGEGPAATATAAALEDADAAVHRGDVAAVADADLAVVTGVAGADGFDAANDRALAGETPWLAVTANGVGTRPLEDVAAAVAGFAPGAGCLRCLDHRLAAASDAGADPGEGGDAAATRADHRLAGAIAGREAVRSLDGDPFTGLIELPHRRRTFLRVPTCESCTPARDRTLSRGGESVDLSTAAARVERAVDDRVGPVAAVGERESYPAPYYLAVLSATDGFSDAAAMGKAAGVDDDWDAAYVKAVGEALERYAAGVYRTDEFRSAPPADLPDAVAPSVFVRPADAPPPDPGRAEQWVPAVDLATDETSWLPAELVHFPPPAERHRPAITTGLGLGTSPDGALASGALEVLERDATMLGWYSSYEPLGLDVDDPDVDALRRRARSESLSVDLSLLTQDVDVPVVAATVRRESWPRFAAGSAAGFDPIATASDALAEALQNWMELRALGRDDAAQAGAAVARYADDASAAPRLSPDDAVPAERVGPVDPPEDVGETVDAAVDEASAAGVDLYATRFTTPDLAALGLEAVRVLSPQAQPLFVDDPYFGERARSVPPELGFAPRLDRAYHPFP
ncbi:MAG: YcaO-like family protein [Halobacteriaceae archaeon]